MKTETWVRLAAIGICTIAAGGAVYVTVRYFLGILLPFALAALTASALRPLSEKLCRRLHIPPKLGGSLVIFSSALLLGFGCISLGGYLYESVRAMISALLLQFEGENGILRGFESFSAYLTRLFPWEEERLGTLRTVLSDMLRSALTSASTALTGAAASALMKLPQLLFSLIAGVIALFYLFFDADRLRGQLRFFFGERMLDFVSRLFQRVREAVGGYIRAWAVLWFLTFCELLAGFLLLDIGYAFPLALLTSFVDILPVLGVGTVLVPFGIFSFLTGDLFRGAGLLILFGVMTLVRQFAEPRIVGGSLGLHPLVTLIAVFAGLRLFGVAGMLFAPVLLYALKAVMESVKAE